MRAKLLIALTLILTLIVVLGGCSSQTATNTSTAIAAATSPSRQSGGSTFGQMANDGATVFASKCSNCHGNNGQGVTAPALIGSDNNLANYGTAQGLLDFISTAMPASAPGSLSHQDYLNVLTYLLVKNNKTSSNTSFNETDLGNISLK